MTYCFRVPQSWNSCKIQISLHSTRCSSREPVLGAANPSPCAIRKGARFRNDGGPSAGHLLPSGNPVCIFSVMHTFPIRKALRLVYMLSDTLEQRELVGHLSPRAWQRVRSTSGRKPCRRLPHSTKMCQHDLDALLLSCISELNLPRGSR